MNDVLPPQPAAQRRHRRLRNEVKASLRELNVQLSLLNHRVGERVKLKEADFGCLNLIESAGEITPSTLARQTAIHPATLTGVLDRLERGGWIARERAQADRRAVIIRPRRDRRRDLHRQLAGMNAAMDDICAGYSEAELELVANFLRRTAEAGREAADQLAPGNAS